MYYKIKPGVQEKRIKATLRYYNALTLATNDAEERLFKAVKGYLNTRSADEIVDTIAKIIGEELEFIADYAYEMAKKVLPVYRKLPWRELLSHRDGKTLEQRIARWCTHDITIERLFALLVRIIETEKFSIGAKTLIEATNWAYVEINGAGECVDEEGPCAEFLHEIYPRSKMTKDMYPPYHPLCECYPCIYAADEVDIVR